MDQNLRNGSEFAEFTEWILLLRVFTDWNVSVGMYFVADQSEGTFNIAISSFKGVGVNCQGCAEYHQRCAIVRTTDRLLQTQSAHGLHWDVYGPDHFTKLIQRAGHSFAHGGDAPAFVVTDMMDDKIAP